MIDYYSQSPERAETYRLLGGLFLKPPDDAVLESLRLFLGMEISESYNMLAGDFKNIMGQIPPFEMFYSNHNGLASPQSVHMFYLKSGIVIDEEMGLPADHLAVEMLFMSYLVENEKLDEQLEFLEKHLLRWAPSYMDAVENRAGTDFYKQISGVTKRFIISDYEELLE